MKRENTQAQKPAPEWVKIDKVPVMVQKNPYIDKLFNLRFEVTDQITVDVYSCSLKSTKGGDLFVSAPARAYKDKSGNTAYAPQARISLGKDEEDILNFLVNGMGL